MSDIAAGRAEAERHYEERKAAERLREQERVPFEANEKAAEERLARMTPYERLVVEISDLYHVHLAADDLQCFFEKMAARQVEREAKLPVSVAENSHAVVVDKVDQVRRMVGELRDLLERSRP